MLRLSRPFFIEIGKTANGPFHVFAMPGHV